MNYQSNTPTTSLDSNPETITSLDIAEVVGLTHKQVLLDIEEIFESHENVEEIDYKYTVETKEGFTYTMYIFDRFMSDTLTTTYGAELHEKVGAKWQQILQANKDSCNRVPVTLTQAVKVVDIVSTMLKYTHKQKQETLHKVVEVFNSKLAEAINIPNN